MPNIIKLTGINETVWVNAEKIMYMKEACGETIVCLDGEVMIFVNERASEINSLISR